MFQPLLFIYLLKLIYFIARLMIGAEGGDSCGRKGQVRQSRRSLMAHRPAAESFRLKRKSAANFYRAKFIKA
ncbi:hypothetical protein KP77_23950 [Jeotgalibacillus alimentarius]|uniref:Uncharacterized protein n=1 Tax=Jeotgalibacillus alimentarius TaxID=135826 RepID=A0A0C2RAF3_9BACL|nr:hypothetical protein KP77_23950 [Jeotgalibacillus alimentarius]